MTIHLVGITSGSMFSNFQHFDFLYGSALFYYLDDFMIGLFFSILGYVPHTNIQTIIWMFLKRYILNNLDIYLFLIILTLATK